MTSADPDLTATRRVLVADERASLAAFLDHYRAIMKAKVAGLSDADARRSFVPTGTSIGGLLKHLRWAEQSWFCRGVAGIPVDRLPARPPHEVEFRMTDGETVAGLIADYDAQCAMSREIAAAHEMTHTFAHRRGGEVSLRWVYLHMIEETARHAGHADILREQIDGVTGPEI